MRRLAAIAAVAVALALGATPVAARTFHDRLGPSAEAAAASFVEAWRSKDYATAYLMFSTKAARAWANSFAQTFSRRDFFERGIDVIDRRWSDMGRPAFNDRTSFPDLLFDDTLVTAERLGALPFAFGPKARFGVVATGSDRAEIRVQTDGRPAEVTLFAVKMVDGPWKIERIGLPGSTPEQLPWGVPQAK